MIKTRKLVLTLFLIMFFTAVAMITGEAYALWYSPNWSYRQMITIDESMIPDNGPLSDFPVLIQLTSSDSNPVFGNARADGYDILFTQADGMTPLSHEIEEYNSATEDMNMWVRIPTLSDTTDTVLYMYYGNPGIASDPSTTSTWDSGFAGVWHLKEEQPGAGNPGVYQDSTINDNDGNDFISDIGQNGQINGGQEFDGVNDYMTINNIPLINTSGYTISAWVRPNGIQAWLAPLVYCCDASNAGFRINNNNNGIQFTIRNAVFAFVGIWSNGRLTEDVWNHVAVVYDFASDIMSIYLNGSFDNSRSSVGGLDPGFYDGSSNFNRIGTQGGRSFNGNLDEIQISSIARTAEWIETSYNNQNNPSSFLSFGAPEVFVPVPTMSQWGMIIFMVLAGIGAIYYIWKRRIAEINIYNK